MSNLLPTDYQTFIATSRYARWLEEEGRRETWSETVSRYMNNIIRPKVGAEFNLSEIEQAILSLEVMPSMRSMMTAGAAANRDNTCMYNCSYLAVDDPKAFDEAMHILLCGTGVGFSVERQYINSLPEIPQLFYSDTIVMVRDSKEGWAKAFRQVLALLWAGEIPKWNVEKIRPAGARLKTFGGRASGPAPLVDLFNFTVTTFKNAQGRKLSSIEAHDLMCKVGEIVVVGGVRRSAMISLSNLSDDRMRHAKSGKWWENDPQRALANNSVAYSEKPDSMSFMREWTALVESGSGERGIFNRQAAIKQAAKNGRRDPNREWGTNPCSEIILAGPRTDPKTGNPIAGTGGQFCNLSEVVVRATDSIEDLERKVRLATILGTVQATYTKFPYLRKVWEKNTAEERLLGV
ncbi:MAG: ribonucleoside-triphosphate reductase, partial [Phycisphaerae bacterium]|nr:ribonucleoside-triphosphate reductase [Phycisphaerae bacterium]